MTRQRFLTIIVAMFASATLSPLPGIAAAATRAHAANQPFPDKQNRNEESPGKRKASVAKSAAQARRDKEKGREKTLKARRIATYKLFRDSQFKLEGAITDRRHFDALTRNPAANAGMQAERPPGTGILQNAFKATQPDNAGLGLNCHEKIISPLAANRETSACYRYELDKSWKAQTYVSRQRTEGNWGGGVTFGIAY